MITRGEIDKLRYFRSPDATVLSLYVGVPLEPAGLTDVRALAQDLIREAGIGGQVNPADEQAALGLLAAHAREWLGHTAAVFVCGDLGLQETMRLPSRIAERAVIDVKPHLRPLFATVQRYPEHQIVIIDRRHVWLLMVSGDRIDAVARASDSDVANAGFGGRYGLELIPRPAARAGACPASLHRGGGHAQPRGPGCRPAAGGDRWSR